jgi:predicted esterase
VLVVLLHGAGGGARDILPIMQAEAERRGWAVLVPQSAGASWDFIVHRFGPDVGMLDQALAATFELLPVDPSRIAISGFSDGGSYALTLGLINGGLFSSVLAFSPGFIGPGEWQGIPRIFISHGRQDSVLPIERCGRRIAAALRQQNYPLHYEEFSGGHVVPTQVVTQAMDFHIEAGSTRDP